MFLKNKNIKLRIMVILLFTTIITTNITPAFALTQTSISAKIQATKEQMISFYEENFLESYPQEYIEQGIELSDFVDIIIEESRREEVRADLVFAQVLIETNNLQFDGELSIEKNNFGNLREADDEYITYDSIADGIRANILLLNSFEGENWFEELEYSATVNQYLEEILNTNIIEEQEEPSIDQHEEHISEQETEEELESEDLSEDKTGDNEVVIRDNSPNSISNVNLELKTKDKKTNFKKSDKYFKVDKNTPIYDNRTGSLVKVGELTKGQVYPRIRDYGADWHEMQFGNIKGYIYKPDTSLAAGNEIKNKNTSRKNQARTFKTLSSVPVYDNTSGSLVQFGTIDKGKTYPIAFDYGNWFGIILSDRVGYVHKNNVEVNFFKNDKYFRVKKNTPIYDNRTGSLVKVGELTKDQVYPRIRDYGADWHEIQFGNIKGYIYKPDTSLATGNEIKNKNTSRKNQARTFKTLCSVPVYDNTSGSLVQFGTIDMGKIYPIAFDYGNWFGIILGDRVGYVHKNNVEVNFLKSDKYFRVKKNTPIYDNRTGSLVKVGELTKGQVYPRIRDYGADWHEIQFGNIKGYILKADTSLATGNEIKNKNTSRKNQARAFKTLSSVPVYDNTSGSLVQFGTIDKGKTYPIAFDYGNWFGIILADRVGYVYKNNVEVNFLKSDKYFRVKNNTPIYDNRTGSLVKVGELTKGQVYPRIRDYGADWHEIQFGNIKGYILKADTSLATGNEIKNKNTSYKNQARTFEALREVPVYDNTSGKLVKFGTINEGTVYYPLAFDYGNWLGIIFAGRVGYVHKSHIKIIDKVNIIYSHYNQTLQAQLNKQMKASPQTDYYGNGWQNAKESEVSYFLNPINFINDERAIFQFLDLSKPSAVSVSDLNKLLKGKGILEGRGSSFSQASHTCEINVIYLLAHANLETGNGTSKLAKGVRVDAKGRMANKDGILIDSKENYVDKNGNKSQTPIKGEGGFKTVYNMFGIGAYDSDPIRLGAGRAFKEDWTTANKAITGGAKFVAQNYIYNEMYGYQNTLYKMRWNPTNLKSYAEHQYATDIGWAYKQANIIKTYYDRLSDYVLYFDIPEYK